MDFGANLAPVEVIKKGALEELILQIFILMLIVNGIKTHGRNLRSKILLLKLL